MGTLFLIATPIGNLEDISQRAVRLLASVRLVAAEDTRHTKKLLTHLGISTSVVSYHEHNKLARLERILAALGDGDVALVSDAGTPGLNDPGYELVRATLDAGYVVSPVPGPSAPIAALVASGLPTDAFVYLGYLPRRTHERRATIQAAAELPYTLIFLETPHRLLAALADLQAVLGERRVAVARELTKLHEEIFRGELGAALAHFQANPPRGEFTLVVSGHTGAPQKWEVETVRQAALIRLKKGTAPSRLAAELAGEAGWPRRAVYQLILDLTKEL